MVLRFAALVAAALALAGGLTVPATAAPGPAVVLHPTAAATAAVVPLRVTTATDHPGQRGTVSLVGAWNTALAYRASLTPVPGSGNQWFGKVALRRGSTPAAPGVYDVEVLLDDGSEERCTRCFTVVTSASPTLAGLSVTSAPRGWDGPVTLTGTGFSDLAEVGLLVGTAPDASVTVGSDPADDTAVRLHRSLGVAEDAPLGWRSVRVRATDGRTATCPKCFAVTEPVTAVTPSGAPNDGPVTVTMTTERPVPTSARVALLWSGDGAPRPELDLVATKPVGGRVPTTTLTGPVETLGAAPGANAYTAGYVLPDGSRHSCGTGCPFTLVQEAPPALAEVSPAAQAPGATVAVSLKGTGFARGATARLVGATTVPVEAAWSSPTAVKLTVAVPPSVRTGAYRLEVRNTDGQTATWGPYRIEGKPVAGRPTAAPVAAVPGPAVSDPAPALAPVRPTVAPVRQVLTGLQPLRLRGRTDPGALVDVFVAEQGSPAGAPAASLLAAADGGYVVELPAPRRASTVWVQARNQWGRSGALAAVQVRPALSPPAVARAGGLVVVSGTVQPAAAGQPVVVRAQSPRRPAVVLGTVKTDAAGRWVLRRPVPGPARVWAAVPAGAGVLAAVGPSTGLR